jgi:hypothetical protein
LISTTSSVTPSPAVRFFFDSFTEARADRACRGIAWMGVAGEQEILEDLVKAAHDDARRKLEDAQNEEMKGLSGGLGILPGFKMPF